MVIVKGLIGRCLNHEMALERVQAKANLTEGKLSQLKAWKFNMDKKFDYFKMVRKELEQKMETMKKVLEDKEKEI